MTRCHCRPTIATLCVQLSRFFSETKIVSLCDIFQFSKMGSRKVLNLILRFTYLALAIESTRRLNVKSMSKKEIIGQLY